jgi:hypothetical protein
MRDEGTNRMPPTPTPKRCQPVSSATEVKIFLYQKDSWMVSAARSGEREAAMTERRETRKRIRSRLHSGQFWHR